MGDPVTWIIVAGVVIVIVGIVVASIVVGSRRREIDRALAASDSNDTDARFTPASPEEDNVLGDRSDVFHRSRRGF